MRDHGSVSYSAAIESAATRDTDKEVSEFAKRATREATRRGFDQAPRRVVLGDGAPWIWNLAQGWTGFPARPGVAAAIFALWAVVLAASLFALWRETLRLEARP